MEPNLADGLPVRFEAAAGAPPRLEAAAGAPPRREPAGSIPPGAWLGLLGGGQLGRMFCMAAQSLGFKVVVLDPGDHSPAGAVADRHVAADYLDSEGLAELARIAKAATTEFENVPAAALEYLARTARVTPAAASVAIAQDRIAEKAFLTGCGLPVAPYVVLRTGADVAAVDPAFLPGILKSARLGYDGKGQAQVADLAEVAAAFRAMGSVECVLEKRIDLACEVSVVVGRNECGDVLTWPVAENRHRAGILDVSIAPARVSADLAAAARGHATTVADRLGYCGVLCVEMFVTGNGNLLVNEIAPRPHNSGHYTIDACVTSQFEQQARVLAALPLGSTAQHMPAVMVNLLGDIWYADAAASAPGESISASGESTSASVASTASALAGPREPDWTRVLRHPQAKLHLYGKAEPRRGRKMGHVTCLGATVDDALATARAIKLDLGIPGAEEI